MYCIPSKASHIESKHIAQKLERALNNKNPIYFKDGLLDEILLKIQKEKDDFLLNFPKAKWSIKSKEESLNGKIILDVSITGERQIEDLDFSLESQQKIAITINQSKIINYEIINESSILKTLKTPLEITIMIPDQVLTGKKYDADIILNQPLNDYFLAGGLIVTNKKELAEKISPYINISPIYAGGIFKSIQAPLKEGKQTLAGLLVHPQGIIAVTKTVNIVSKINK